MVSKIFVNLPVKSLATAKEFFTKLGLTFNAQFTDDRAACLEIGGNIYAMLLLEKYFIDFTKKDIPNTQTDSEVILSLAVNTRDEVDMLVKKALAGGGKESSKPNDLGFMYSWGFQDPDGHLWEVFYMDPAEVKQGI